MTLKNSFSVSINCKRKKLLIRYLNIVVSITQSSLSCNSVAPTTTLASLITNADKTTPIAHSSTTDPFAESRLKYRAFLQKQAITNA